MKKLLLLSIVGLVLAGLAAWILVRSEAGVDRPEVSASAPRAAKPEIRSPAAHAPRREARPAVLRGVVIDGSRRVAEAIVLARSEHETRETRTGDDGTFALELPPGGWVLSARTYTLASAVFGPLLLEEAQVLEELQLELFGAASVSGRVVDAITGEAIASARIRSSAGEVVSDHAGRFELSPLPATETWLEASSPKHLARLEWLTLDGSRHRSGLELYLRPAALVSGQVVRQGAPVAGATVGARIVSGVTAGAPDAAPVRADGEGRFLLALSGGVVELWASAEDSARVEGPSLRIAEGESRENVMLELGEGLVARGDVLYDGQPLSGAIITLLNARDFTVVGAARTDGAGRFQVQGLAPGSFLVQAEIGSFSGQRGPFTLTGGGDVPWQVEIEGTRILSGRVEPPQPGVLVRWRSPDWAGTDAGRTSTASDGTFHFAGVPEGLLTIDAEGQGGAAQVRARAGDAVVLRLEQSALRGSVQDERGRSVTDFTVRLEREDGGPSRTLTVVSPTGDFLARLPPGRYRVHVRATGQGMPGSTPSVDVPPGGEASVVITLSAGRRIHGYVRRAATREPLAGVEVGFHVNGRTGSANAVAVVRTDANGYFDVASVPRQAWVRLRAEGFRQQWVHPRRLPASSDAPVEWLLGPGNEAHGDMPAYEGIGAVLSVREGRVQINSTFEGSPAQAAGLVQGDVILAIDGRPAAAADASALQPITQRIMGPAGSVVRLTIGRGDQTNVVPVRRRKIAP